MNYYDEFIRLLEEENKDQVIQYVINLLDQNDISLEYLYEELIKPALNNFICQEEEISIWREHTRTSIIRTILEISYLYVIKRKSVIEQNNLKVLVLTPSEEYHEIGGLIVTNYFNLAGFDARFIGANTPKNDIILALNILKPDFLALSVTNYYNIVVTKKIIDDVKSLYPQIKVIIGGLAFSQSGVLSHLKYDYHLTSQEDINAFAKEVTK